MKYSLRTIACSICFVSLSAFAQDVKLRGGEQLEIRLGGVPSDEIQQVSGSYQVDGEGFVNLPHVGRIRAGGLSQSQLQEEIETAYRTKQIYTNPTITISVSAAARFVNVSGAVRSPRRVEFTPDLTVLGAISAVGGLNEFANPKNVKLLREGKVTIININEVKKDPSLDLKLRPGDSIDVQQSFW